MKNKFEINKNARIADIGAMVNEAIFQDDQKCTEAVRDMLFDIHSMIYPNASRIATLEESLALAAAAEEAEKRHSIISDTCLIETGLLCAVDSLDHAVHGIGEGTQFMSLNAQIGIILGASALIKEQLSNLAELRMSHINGQAVTA